MQELTPGSVKAAFQSKKDLWTIYPDDVRVIDGYNARVVNEAYTDKVRWLADRMIQNGYDHKFPLGGYVANVGGESVVYLTSGHRRLEAVKLARSEGALIDKVPVIVSPKGTCAEDLDLELLVASESDPLSTYEQTIPVKRLAAAGWSSAQIALKAGFASAQYVDGLLLLAGSPLPVRRMVEEGIVSATLAISTLRKHGDKAHEVLTAALAYAAGRVTAKNLPGAKLQKAVRKQAQPMYDVLQKVMTTPSTRLAPDLIEAINNILTGIKP